MKNVGSIDQAIRIVIGVLLISAMFFPPFGLWQYVKLVAGVMLIATALLRVCPAYWLFGFKSK